jgi:hypothetical protein
MSNIYTKKTLNFNKEYFKKTISLFRSTGVVYVDAKINISLKERCSRDPVLTVDLKNINEFTELNISGECTAYKNGTILHQSSGQIQNDIMKYFGNNDLVVKLVSIWNRWNFNGIKIGTTKQNEQIESELGKNIDYSTAVKHLHDTGLEKDNGFYYGQTWLVENLPKETIKDIIDICRKLS